MRTYRPYFYITCYINNTDISQYLKNITIMNGINLPYQTIEISFELDNRVLSSGDLYGSKDLMLEIHRTTEDMISTETTSVELIILNPNSPMNTKPLENSYSNPKENKTTIYCIPKTPFVMMTKIVNKLFNEKSKLKPIEMVELLIDKFTTGLNLDIKHEGENKDIIYQFIVPPMTLNTAIKYIDGTDQYIMENHGYGLGIYNGPLFFQTIFDNNTFCMWDLSKIIKSSTEYTVYYITEGLDTTLLMKGSGTTDDIFYSYGKIDTKFTGNTDTIKYAYKSKFLISPTDNLYDWKEFSINDVIDENGIQDGKPITDTINSIIKDREEYYTDSYIGSEYGDSLFKSILTKRFSSGFEISFSLHRNLSIKRLLKVGVPIEFRPQIDGYMDYRGKYIVSSSIITFKKESESWECIAQIKAFRSNLKY